MPARKKTTKKAAKKRISKEAKAFDLALRTPEEATVPKPVEQPPVDNWDADDFDPHAPASDTKVNLRNGQTTTVEELIKSEISELEQPVPSEPVIPSEPSTPPVKAKPQKTTKAAPTRPYTLQEASVIIEALIDALNHLYSFAKRKVKQKDVPILEDRVKRGRLLVEQFKNV